MMYRNRKLLDLMGNESRLAIRAGIEFNCTRCRRFVPTCGAHSNQQRHGKGRGIKAHDCFAAALCRECHAWVDGGERERAVEGWFKAHCETFVQLHTAGVIEVPLLVSGTLALPGTVDSNEWLRLWVSGDARVTV